MYLLENLLQVYANPFYLFCMPMSYFLKTNQNGC